MYGVAGTVPCRVRLAGLVRESVPCDPRVRCSGIAALAPVGLVAGVQGRGGQGAGCKAQGSGLGIVDEGVRV